MTSEGILKGQEHTHSFRITQDWRVWTEERQKGSGAPSSESRDFPRTEGKDIFRRKISVL